MSPHARLGRFVLTLSMVGGSLVACSSSSGSSTPTYKLAWSDEFDSAALDTTKWSYDTGNDFGTGQQDYDTNRTDNVSVANGVLTLTALNESYMSYSYTSGRIETGTAFSQQYGRFEANIKLPTGQGMWPAFWLLGSNETTVGWPECGEIDIMEMRGAQPTSVVGSLHGPGGDNLTAGFTLPAGGTFDQAFHVFAVEWDPSEIRWYVDDNLYETRDKDTLPNSQPWVFDHPFFVILDLAVGGQFGGDVGTSTTFPQTMQIDYVRVYSE